MIKNKFFENKKNSDCGKQKIKQAYWIVGIIGWKNFNPEKIHPI